jgi:short-subunit dehydrogenase
LGTLSAESVADTSYADMDYVVRTNLLGYMRCAQEAARLMKERKTGHIVNIGSMSAESRKEGNSVYVATQSGVQGFSEALSKELNPILTAAPFPRPVHSVFNAGAVKFDGKTPAAGRFSNRTAS